MKEDAFTECMANKECSKYFTATTAEIYTNLVIDASVNFENMSE
jgi:hypothetical protein